MTTKAGQLITDGTAVWIIDDVRDGARVGDIILRPTLRDGYIKANGATIKASEYPRLLAWVQEAGMTATAEQYQTDCSKYVYDAAQDKLTLPNAVGRVLQGGENVKSVEAGLPNITGEWSVKKEHKTVAGVQLLAELEIDERGALYVAEKGERNGIPDYPTIHQNAPIAIGFDASKSNSIYGRSETVQPPALTMIAQIKY
nr:MAG TPA: LONG TAIL FIBER PROTEIN [Caudoviricetes sp.]